MISTVDAIAIAKSLAMEIETSEGCEQIQDLIEYLQDQLDKQIK